MAPKVEIVFIVNGEDVRAEANLHAPLLAAVEQALARSHNTGRPPQDWEVRDAAGILLEMGRKVEDFRFQAGVRLFLNLRVGAGGAQP